jgi:hypothetical protein
MFSELISELYKYNSQIVSLVFRNKFIHEIVYIIRGMFRFPKKEITEISENT